MVDDTAAAPAESTPAPAPSLPADSGPVDARTAASAISAWRAKALAQAEPAEKTEQPREKGRFTSAAAPQESAPEGDDIAAETPSGEEEGAEAETPIEPPHSWTKAEKERFAGLPRETQAYLAERESARDAELNRRQHETAEKSKALEAKEQAAEQARQQYETAAQNALRTLNAQVASEFADIKTQDDVVKLATEDPFRAIQFKARQDQLNALHQEVQANEQKKAQDEQERFKTWSKEQDDKFSKRFPDFNDPEKGPKLRASVQTYLTKEVGVPEDVLPKLWNNPLFRDEMFQRVIYEASRFHEAQQRAKSAVQAPKPAPQRPGVAPQKGSQLQEEIAAATTRLQNSRGIEAARAAADLMAAKRRASARR